MSCIADTATPHFEHDHPFLHWDLMLESGAVLRTWRLLTPPAAGQTVRAEAIGDHRPAYLDYEGPVSRGRGTVQRWDNGTFEWEETAEDRIVVRLDGKKIKGKASLRREGAEWASVLTDQKFDLRT